MSNLYEILEVSEKASKEVIDKAYHVLAKKYHPDLQLTQEKKKQAEIKMMKINEAYDILGNEQKRKIYDLKLKQEAEEQKRKEQQKQFEELAKYENMHQTRKENAYTYNKNQYIPNNFREEENIKKIGNGVIEALGQAYSDYWKKRKTKLKEPWTFKKLLKILKILAIVIIIITVIWLFPPTNKLIVGAYENNVLIKTIVDISGKIIVGIVNGIIYFFKNITHVEGYFGGI